MGDPVLPAIAAIEMQSGQLAAVQPSPTPSEPALFQDDNVLGPQGDIAITVHLRHLCRFARFQTAQPCIGHCVAVRCDNRRVGSIGRFNPVPL